MTDWSRYHEIDALRESGQPAEALSEFKALRETVTSVEDRSSILLGESLSYRDLGRLAEAASAASEAVELLPPENPTRLYAEFCLAVAREGEGKFELAAQEFKSLLKKHADLLKDSEHIRLRRDAQFRLIANLIVLGHALEPLSIVKALKSEEVSDEERAELSYREAEANRILGRHDQALKLYEDALDGVLERPLIPQAHFHIGEVLYDRGAFSSALEQFKLAEALADPGSPNRRHFAKWAKHTLNVTETPRPEW
jgi:tetratricopeptide (TPR) repeat protein